jgi:hypothetical protein
VASEQDPQVFFKLGRALKEQGKYDEAITALDQSIERGGVKMPNGRDAAALLKAETIKAKEGGAAPGAQAGDASAAPQVQIVPNPNP